MDFKDLTMKFDQEGNQYKFQGITVGSLEITSSHRMETLLKKGHFGVVIQLHANQATETPRYCKTSKPSFLNINWSFPLPKASLLPMVFMIIPFPLYQEAFFPISVCIVTPFPKKMKLRKWSRNSLIQVLSTLVRAPIHLLWSWS
jgi:hypothetical protein